MDEFLKFVCLATAIWFLLTGAGLWCKQSRGPPR